MYDKNSNYTYFTGIPVGFLQWKSIKWHTARSSDKMTAHDVSMLSMKMLKGGII